MPLMDDAEASVEPLQKITKQRVVIDYVFWQDFLWSPCRVWAERRWVSRDVYMSREELKKRFGDKIGEAVPLTGRSFTQDRLSLGSTPKHVALATARVTEVWDRTTRKVLWLSEDYPEILDTQDDPLGLTGFEPCPEPMLANNSTSSTTPRPDYYMIQDQYPSPQTGRHCAARRVSSRVPAGNARGCTRFRCARSGVRARQSPLPRPPL